MSVLPDLRLPSRRFDVVVALVGLVLSLALLPLPLLASEIFVETIPFVLFAACALYLLSVRHSRPVARTRWTLSGGGLAAAELVGIGLAATAALAVSAGTRTLPVLLLSGAVGALILLQTVFLSDEALDERLVLAQILAHALVVRFTGLFTTPGLIGVDNWTHITEYAAAVREAGSLAPMSSVKYYLAPFHHLTTVVGSELLGVTLRVSEYLLVGGTVTVAVLLVYGIGRYFLDVRWALFATAAFAVSEHAIRWGLHVIPTSLGLVFFLGIVFVVARILHTEPDRADWLLLGGFIVAITLTHQLSSFVSLVFVGSAVAAQLLVRHVDWVAPASLSSGSTEFANETGSGRQSGDAITDGASATLAGSAPLHGAFLFHLAFTGTTWALTPWSGERFLFRAVTLFRVTLRRSAGFLHLVPSGEGAAGAAGGGTATAFAQLAEYVDAFGLLVLLFLTVVGVLALLRDHRSPQASQTLFIAIGLMLVFALLLPLFGIRNFLPGRWFVFAYALMAVVGAVGLQHLDIEFPTRAVTVLFVVVLLLYPFAMVSATKATLDDPTFDDQWPRYAFSESELAAMDVIDERVPDGASPIRTDHPYRSAIAGSGAHPTATLNLSELRDRERPYPRTVYRRYQSTGAPQFVTDGGVVVTRQIDDDLICPSTANRVYENRDTRLCTRPDV